jgi:hypothetical protein
MRLTSLAPLLMAAVCLIARPAVAADAPTNEELKRQLDVVAGEVQKLRTGDAGATGGATADRSSYGFAPGASKIYRTGQGVSIGGYGQLLYENFASSTHGGDVSNEQDRIDLLQAVIYFGYRFDEHWLFNSETEFEHASTEVNGAVGIEFAYLDRLTRPEVNFRVGYLLMPLGLLNELHEPTIFLGTHRPEVERRIIPSTWSEPGLGIFGELGPVTYRWYLVGALNAGAFDAEEGIREGRQKASEAIAESWGTTLRVDYTGMPGLLAGVGLLLGNATTPLDPAQGGGMAVPIHLYETHVDYRWRGLQLRALGAFTFLSKIESLNAARNLLGEDSIGNEQRGYYLEAGYDVCSGEKSALIPFVRWEDLDTQLAVPGGFSRNPANHRRNLTVGVNYKPIDQLVFKADYQNFLLGDSSGVNQWNLAAGYVF